MSTDSADPAVRTISLVEAAAAYRQAQSDFNEAVDLERDTRRAATAAQNAADEARKHLEDASLKLAEAAFVS